jgi:outer membrane protein assembly factor BamB
MAARGGSKCHEVWYPGGRFINSVGFSSDHKTMSIHFLRLAWLKRGCASCSIAASLVVGAISAHAQAGSEIWRFVTPEPILASPAVGPDGTIYVGSYDRYVYALAPSGDVLWSTLLPEPTYIYWATYAGVYGTLALGADGTVYVPSENGKLLALDPATGIAKWTYSTTTVEGLYSSPAIAPDGTIYFSSYDRNLYAINPDGTRKWFSRFDSTIFASPAVGSDGTVYCGADDGNLYAINPLNGTRKWTFGTGTSAITASPAIAADGTIYLGVGSEQNPRFFSISPNGQSNWVFTAGSRVRSSAAIGPDGAIYFGCDDGHLSALEPDGTERWSFPAGSPVGSSPALAADGTIYFGCDDGKLYALNSSGNELWNYQSADYVFASPAIGPDGTVYVTSADGALYVLRGCSPPAVSAWPMFRQNMTRTGRAPAPSANRSPVLDSVSDQIVAKGDTLIFIASATDPDMGQELAFSLGVGAPVGATVDATTGVFEWSPSGNDDAGMYYFSMVVTDDAEPPLSDVQCFSVTVTPGEGGLEVSPAEGLSASGMVSGPFSPSSMVYTLANTGSSSLDWTASKTQDWVSLSETSGALAAGASTTVTVSINATADSLATGSYSDTVSFVNDSVSGDSDSLPVTLQVGSATTLAFTSYRLTDPGTFHLIVEGTVGTEVVLEASADLSGWTAIGTNQISADGTASFSDTDIAGRLERLYRVRTIP